MGFFYISDLTDRTSSHLLVDALFRFKQFEERLRLLCLSFSGGFGRSAILHHLPNASSECFTDSHSEVIAREHFSGTFCGELVRHSTRTCAEDTEETAASSDLLLT